MRTVFEVEVANSGSERLVIALKWYSVEIEGWHGGTAFAAGDLVLSVPRSFV